MKFYNTLLEAQVCTKRNKRAVVLALGINDEAFFVTKSSQSTSQQMKTVSGLKLELSQEILEKSYPRNTRDIKHDKLHGLLMSSFTLPLEPVLHAEENMLKDFPRIIATYQEAFPSKPVSSIDIYLSHSPCSSKDTERACSLPRELNGVQMPGGCFEKLNYFFSNSNYFDTDSTEENSQKAIKKDCKISCFYNNLFVKSKDIYNDSLFEIQRRVINFGS